MKRAFFASALALTTVFGLLVMAGGLGALYNETLKQNCLDGTASYAASTSASLSGADLTVKGQKITAVQERNAATIISVGLGNGLSERDATIAIMTAIQESSLVNIGYGYPGSTSVGLFQQIAAWGSYSARMDPQRSSYMFYFGGQRGQSGLTDIVNRENMSLGAAAQAVQHSAYPDAYSAHETEARAIVGAFKGGSSDTLVHTAASISCPSEDPIEDAVLAALGRRGSQYNWSDSSGAGLTSWAFGEAGITVPKTLSGLEKYKGNETEGIGAKLLPASEVKAPSDIRRGDIVLSSSDGSDTPDTASIALGDGPVTSGSDLRIGTYNVLGANHTSEASADARIEKVANRIGSEQLGVIGLQELRPSQRTALLDLLGHYAIYPRRAVYGNNDVSVNSIIWDDDLFELVSGTKTPMPFYFNNHRKDIPLVKLRDRHTGQEFYVVNTHDPAHEQYAFLRYQNAKEHARQMEQLGGEGAPMYFTGDFNSGFGVRSAENTTYQDKRENLTWCIMTASGTMHNAYDAWKGRSGCPKETTDENGVGVVDHVYVSSGVIVNQYTVVRENTGSDHPLVYAVVSQGGGAASAQPAASTIKPVDDHHILAVGKARSNVDITQVDVGRVIAVLRLSVTGADIVPVSAETGTWVRPMVKGTYQLPSSSAGNYGWRIHPVTGRPDFHNGIDLAAATGTPVYSIGSGVVLRAYYDNCWGNLVIVDHGEYLSMYDHLSAFAAGLSVGDTVKAGQRIAAVGNTGSCSAGSHLHFTVGTSLEILRGEQAGSVDPSIFMRERGVVL